MTNKILLFNAEQSNRQTLIWSAVLLFLYSLYLLTALTVPMVGKAGVILLFIAGLLGLYFYSGEVRGYLTIERWLLVAFCLFSVISIVSFFYWPHSRVAQMYLEDYGTFLLLAPLYSLLRHFHFNFRVIAILLSVAAFSLGIVSILQYAAMKFFNTQILIPDTNHTLSWLRPSGGVNPMRYGAISLFLSSVALNGFLFLQVNRYLKVFFCVSAFMGLIACYLADSRGAFIAAVGLFGLYCFYLFKTGRIKLLAIIFILACSMIAILAQNERVRSVVGDVNKYLQGDAQSSLGARFDMFEAAIILIRERPIWGYGLGGYLEGGKEVRKLHPDMDGHVGTWGNPHNEILHVMVEKGVVGLITLILIFAIPYYLFVKALSWKQASQDSEASKSFYAFSGLALLIVYGIVGQSTALFVHDTFVHFFALIVILFASQISIMSRDEPDLQR